ncbi:MAG: AAA family ATPase [Methylophilus sp.]|nr:AAA family ATPase [Methylophilus sp.]
MKINKIEINNFRLLQNLILDLEEDLSLVIGKNNTGKTSILSILDKFLNTNSDKKRFSFEDLSVSLQEQLNKIINGEITFPSEIEFEKLPLASGISMIVFIEYKPDDDISLLQPLIMSPDVDDNNIILSFEFRTSYDHIKAMKDKYDLIKKEFGGDSLRFIKEKFSSFFGPIKRKSILSTDHKQFLDLDEQQISLKDILNFEYIGAKRDVTNKENNKTLSTQTSKIYKDVVDSDEHNDFVEQLKSTLLTTDSSLNQTYGNLFKKVLERVSKYGGVKSSETKIKITSTLQSRELLDNNTTVIYSHENHDLPEFHNGLGYMNLISIIFDIEIMMSKLRRAPSVRPAAINLIFIEEPEAHTHPQMQYVFIKNIKKLLNEARDRPDGKIHLQSIISTHSSHIVSECDFNDVKYLKRHKNNIEAKNLRQLQSIYNTDETEKKNFKFLKQYLTLNRSEIFFADKAILIEGDTERILLPAFMKKIDQENTTIDSLPLLSQNISIIEVGAHAQTFEKFIDFIGIKSLLITDIDSNYEEEDIDPNTKNPKTNKNGNVIYKTEHCCPNHAKAASTSNTSLSFFHKTNVISHFVKLTDCTQKTFKKVGDEWHPNTDGILFTAYQTEENGYHGRSFEDAFFNLNKGFLKDNKNSFPSLTKAHVEDFLAEKTSALIFSEKAVNSKPSLAIEILLNSKSDNGKDFTNWEVPSYIKEGLVWLAKD